jgi:hypothetical protein
MRLAMVVCASMIRNITTIIILATIVVLSAWDIVAFHYGGTDATISRISLTFMCANPELAVAVGALLGHLTWPALTAPNRTMEIVLLVVGLVGLLVMGLFHVLPPMLPVWPLLLGVPLGHALFGQQVSPAQRLARALERH